MKCINLFVVIAVLIINSCYAITCEQVKTIYNLEFEGNCCDLQQFTCDSTGKNILSMDILSLTEKKEKNKLILDEPEVEKEEEIKRKLFPRKFKKHHHHFNDDDDECNNIDINNLNVTDNCSSAQSVQLNILFYLMIALFLSSQLF